jgi:endonuclease YncB( thermonuclease family)
MRPLLVFLSILLTPAMAAQAAADCEHDAIRSGTVASVRDGRTFVLADGREVRLLGIETGSSGEVLRRLIAGKTIWLERVRSADRQGVVER